MITVLHSVAGPDGRTRYIDQMVGGAAADVSLKFFSWRTALTADFDVFHVHWPEMLIRDGNPLRAVAKRIALRLLLRRLRRRRIPVVRTLHNTRPHESGSDTQEDHYLQLIDDATTLFIRLNPTTEVSSDRLQRTILHGHYRDRFAEFPRSDVVPGRILYFGLIRPYKGVDELLRAFANVKSDDLSLRVVGRPTPELRQLIETAAAQDPRVSYMLEFVPDDVLVDEVSKAELVVLPYREVENSGVVLVALSLDRPVVITSSASSEALAAEVGGHWVQTFSGPLTATTLLERLARVRTNEGGEEPSLSQRDWHFIGEQHRAAYRDAIQSIRRPFRASSSVFVSTVGQDSNVGDSVLRRAYLDALRRAGQLHVLVGDNSKSYVSALHLGPHDIVYASRRAWWGQALRSALRSKTLVAYNAGEMQSSKKFFVSYLRHAALILVARFRGGTGVHAGMGIRRKTRLSPLIGVALQASSIVSWRDAKSREWSKLGEVNPDWAFNTRGVLDSPAEAGMRPYLAVSMRGDRVPPSDTWIRNISRVAKENSLRILLVVQVQRDGDMARELAHSHGWELLDWPPDVDHADHELRIRAVYAQSRAVVSDRLHALVIGATEGATPIGYSSAPVEKVERTLRAAGFDSHVWSGGQDEDPERWLADLIKRSDVDELVQSARHRLELLTERIAALGVR